MSSDLATLLGRQERANLEFKRTARDRDAIRKAICALANDLAELGEGRLIIGVGDDGQGVGVPNGDDELLTITNFRNDGKLLPRPTFTVHAATWDGLPVIDVRVAPSPSPPVALDGRIWVRTGPATVIASRSDEVRLVERRRSRDQPFDERPVPGAYLNDLDLDAFERTYLRAAVAPDVLEANNRSVEHQLATARMWVPDYGCATVTGIVTLGVEPVRFVPGAYLQFVRYDGTDAAAPVAASLDVTGPLIDALPQLDLLIRANLRVRPGKVSGLSQTQLPDYPLPAIREAVVNAYCHRDYESSNSPIQVRWFSDRIEIISPGGPFGAVNAENFDVRTDYRNPSIAAALKVLGFVERFGSGIARIRSSMRAAHSPEPRFDIDRGWWQVTLPSGDRPAP